MKLPPPNLIDRMISALAPERGLRRYRARVQFAAVAGISGGGLSVERDSASDRGTSSNWHPTRTAAVGEAWRREKSATRAEDLVANNAHAASVIESYQQHVIGGRGLTPQSAVDWQSLGIDAEQAEAVQRQAEISFEVFARECSATGVGSLADIQQTLLWSVLVKGELLLLPHYRTRPGKRFRLCLQPLDPLRIMSPRQRINDALVRDGIAFNAAGERQGLYIANPPTGSIRLGLSEEDFLYRNFYRGHQPRAFHSYFLREPEQVRGVSLLSPAMKLFNDLGDYLDYALVGQIVASSFPVFIETQIDPALAAANATGVTAGALPDITERFQQVEAGQVLYGGYNQKPHLLQPQSPGQSFQVFLDVVAQQTSAASGLPLDVVRKKFDASYSAARASLNEAWLVFANWRYWLERHVLQPVWEMVFEEAVANGMIRLPAGSPDFYEARHLWTAAKWRGQGRETIDPLKDQKAITEGRANGSLTLQGIAAERGEDWEGLQDQQIREEKRMSEKRQAAGLPDLSPGLVLDSALEETDEIA